MSKLKTRKIKTKTLKPTPHSRFNDALARYHRIHKQHSTFRDELDALIARVKPQIEHSEIERLESLLLLTAKLTSFMSKKSLPEYLRDVLINWIQLNFQNLSLNPFSHEVDLTSLEETYEAHLNLLQGHKIDKTLNRMRKEGHSEEDIKEAKTFFNEMHNTESFEEFMENCNKLFGNEENEASSTFDANPDAPKMDDMFGFDEAINTDNEFDPFDHQDDYGSEGIFNDPQEEQEAQLTRLLKKTSINKLFRRIAKAIHPDLEQNEEKKRQKHVQMSELIEARDAKDIAKILDIYTNTFGALPDDFPESDFDTLSKIINFKTEKLRHTKTVVLNENPFYANFYEWFYAKSIKQENRKIKVFCDSLAKDTSEHLLAHQEITSIKSLRPFLEEMNNTNLHGSFDDLHSLFDEGF